MPSILGHFETILLHLIGAGREHNAIVEAGEQFDPAADTSPLAARSLNAAFLIGLAGQRHPDFNDAEAYLQRMEESSQFSAVATYYERGRRTVREEIANRARADGDFADRLRGLADGLSGNTDSCLGSELREAIWSVFCPEATGLDGSEHTREQTLRRSRTVTIEGLSDAPVTNPASEVLFTSNALLCPPLSLEAIDNSSFGDVFKTRLVAATKEPQQFWYDHPIPMGVDSQRNEVIYGLRGLHEAAKLERARGNMGPEQRVSCLLSVSVTHAGLQDLAREYLETELCRSGALDNLTVYAFTESDTRQLLEEVLAPAARYYCPEMLPDEDSLDALSVFGVDGEYGRHYTFLKAIAAFWKVFIDTRVEATFKIDLDQVFPQEQLIEETGASAFEHLMTPLWGARGVDDKGEPVELGMIAGALVNERDIHRSVFIPDVPYPKRALSADEYIFFSALPQALSSRAEMMTRYRDEGLDGKNRCIQRVHVTGGTNGIRVDGLRRHRPFTPSFIGRAEDQAFILSVVPRTGPRLAYLHQDGLIMRHDKEAFAQDSIQAAAMGKLVGDYVRILYFSAYARVLACDPSKIKDWMDPFTGCFISSLPTTVTYLRASLKACQLFTEGNASDGAELITLACRRLTQALDFVSGQPSELAKQYRRERSGWDLYYEALSAVEKGLGNGDHVARELAQRAKTLVRGCLLRTGSGVD